MRRREVLALGGAAIGGAAMGGGLTGGVARGEPVPAPNPALGLAREPDAIIDLWPGAPPGAPPSPPQQTIEQRATHGSLSDRALHHVARPVLWVFRPARPDGSALLLCPGGAYERLAIDKEGVDCALAFAEWGVTGFILTYRLPGDPWAAGPDAPLQDAQRAIRLIRAGADGFGVDVQRIAVLGASAGGHLAGALATRFAERVYEPIDAVDTLSARPDGVCLLYPVVTLIEPIAHGASRRALLAHAPDAASAIQRLSNETRVTADMPPVFLIHAADDDVVPVANALRLLDALTRTRVPVEAHLFESGGHGFGLRGIAGRPPEIWPRLFHAWGARHGLFARTR